MHHHRMLKSSLMISKLLSFLVLDDRSIILRIHQMTDENANVNKTQTQKKNAKHTTHNTNITKQIHYLMPKNSAA